MFEHGIQHRQQFMHTGRQGDLGCFAGLTQSLVERFQDTIMTSRHQRAHIERSPHGRAATPDRPLSTEGAAVSIQRATPTKAAICLCVKVPNSGNSASRVRVTTGPMPGTLCNSSSYSRQIGLAWTAVVRS